MIIRIIFAILILFSTNACSESNKGDSTMKNEWKTNLVNSALNKYLPIITKDMTSDEKIKAENTYRVLLRYNYTNKERSRLGDEVFNEMLTERITKAQSMSIELRRKLLHEDTFKAEFKPLNKFAENTAIDVLNGKAVSPELRVKTEDVLKKLEQMRVRLENEFPELNESVGHFISESLVDCDYILHEGKGQKMSLRLSHIYRRMHSKE